MRYDLCRYLLYLEKYVKRALFAFLLFLVYRLHGLINDLSTSLVANGYK